ncbi:MAG TPA: response regulator [Bacteroidales bacterium]|nr:response regulator [Bacteroidales bacterium]
MKRLKWTGKAILIVEDSDVVVIYYGIALKTTGATIITTMDGDEAVEICRERDIDIILMDLYLPSSNGFDTTRRIREFNQDVPIIAHTSYNDDEEMVKSLAAGCTEFIPKPLRLKEFYSVLSKYLDKS